MSDYSNTFTESTGDTIDTSDFSTEFSAIETAIATKADKTSSSGDITIDGLNARGMTLLDTPEQLLYTTSPASTNTAVTSATLDTAGATAAIVYAELYADSSAKAGIELYCASDDIVMDSNLHRKCWLVTVNGDDEIVSTEFSINLDSNNDFWYKTADSTDIARSVRLILVGYYT